MSKRIIHVEDDKNWREIVQEELAERGFEIEGFPSVEAAMEVIETLDKADIVLLVDGTLDELDYRGGYRWATSMHTKGYTLAMVSADIFPGAPMVCFWKVSSRVVDDLVEFLNEVTA